MYPLEPIGPVNSPVEVQRPQKTEKTRGGKTRTRDEGKRRQHPHPRRRDDEDDHEEGKGTQIDVVC